jgi:hypothetical protein
MDVYVRNESEPWVVLHEDDGEKYTPCNWASNCYMVTCDICPIWKEGIEKMTHTEAVKWWKQQEVKTRGEG